MGRVTAVVDSTGLSFGNRTEEAGDMSAIAGAARVPVIHRTGRGWGGWGGITRRGACDGLADDECPRAGEGADETCAPPTLFSRPFGASRRAAHGPLWGRFGDAIAGCPWHTARAPCEVPSFLQDYLITE